jgi:DNA polymerase-3 subunit epsilon
MSRRVIILDTETTGLDKKKDRIVELAMLEKSENGQDLRFFHEYFKPGRKKLSEEVRKLLGFDESFLKDKPEIAGYLEQVGSWLAGSVVVAHNARFDMNMLEAEFERANLPFPANVEVVDTLEVARRTLLLPNHKLDTLCDVFNVDRSGRVYHGALLDCELLWEVYGPLLARAQQELLQVESLMQASFAPDRGGDFSALAIDYLQAHRLLGYFERIKTDRAAKIREVLGEQSGLEEDGFFAALTDSKTTDWKKIVQSQLPDFDTTPFQRTGESKLTVKFSKETVDAEAALTETDTDQLLKAA